MRQSRLQTLPLACPPPQALRHELHTGSLQPGARLLLDIVTDPRRQLTGGGGAGTLRGGPLHLLPGEQRSSRIAAGHAAASSKLQHG